ncbi:hypothetical protein BST63_10595 [Bradyrhizobium canariense]|uniref:Uncharacterized protein n=2 Tax=Bradyrhizobium canariense TaxID=255045 RepID=A0ABX3X7L6_9BRAD|nr:hypothetical protein BSR47_11665 [Bradyrhizobium canariense]OSJ31086.1 hypothetical protein BST63_10595 [Bradyrhizobium canariense]
MGAALYTIRDATAAQLMQHLEAGKTVQECGIKRASLELYLKDHPDFAAKALPLIDANAKAAQSRKGHNRNKTHCKFGHPLSGANLFRSTDGFRRCRACFSNSMANNRTVNEDQARRVVEALNAGAIISQFTKANRPGYILNNRALTLFRRKHPKFDRFVLKRSAANVEIRRGEGSPARDARIIEKSDALDDKGADIFALIRAAVPYGLPAQIRQDTISAMALAIVQRRLKPSDIRRRTKEFVSAQFESAGWNRARSLDAHLFSDGDATLLDRLSTEAETGYWDVNMMVSAGRRK